MHTEVPTKLSKDVAFRLGAASLIVAIFGLGLISIMLGCMGVMKAKQKGEGNGLAVAGVIIGVLEVVFGVLIIAVIATTSQ